MSPWLLLRRRDCSAHFADTEAKVTSSNSAISRQDMGELGSSEVTFVVKSLYLTQVSFTIYNKSANGYRFTMHTALNCINQAFHFFKNHIAEQKKVFQVKAAVLVFQTNRFFFFSHMRRVKKVIVFCMAIENLCWFQPAAEISDKRHWPPPLLLDKELLLSLFLKLKPNCFESL